MSRLLRQTAKTALQFARCVSCSSAPSPHMLTFQARCRGKPTSMQKPRPETARASLCVEQPTVTNAGCRVFLGHVGLGIALARVVVGRAVVALAAVEAVGVRTTLE